MKHQFSPSTSAKTRGNTIEHCLARLASRIGWSIVVDATTTATIVSVESVLVTDEHKRQLTDKPIRPVHHSKTDDPAEGRVHRLPSPGIIFANLFITGQPDDRHDVMHPVRSTIAHHSHRIAHEQTRSERSTVRVSMGMCVCVHVHQGGAHVASAAGASE